MERDLMDLDMVGVRHIFLPLPMLGPSSGKNHRIPPIDILNEQPYKVDRRLGITLLSNNSLSLQYKLHQLRAGRASQSLIYL